MSGTDGVSVDEDDRLGAALPNPFFLRLDDAGLSTEPAADIVWTSPEADEELEASRYRSQRAALRIIWSNGPELDEQILEANPSEIPGQQLADPEPLPFESSLDNVTVESLDFKDEGYILADGIDGEYDFESESSETIQSDALLDLVPAINPTPVLKKTTQTIAPLRGIGLLGAVFEELSKYLGAKFSTADLLTVAQSLIDLSKTDFVGRPQKDPTGRPGYYSWDLVTAFASHPWDIADVETSKNDHCDIDEYSPETFENAQLILQGRHERLWEI